MHACLNVDEILRSIASELVQSGLRRTAVALACCCRAFEDPVLDALWETKYHLMHLLRTLPQDIWSPVEPKVRVAIVIFGPSPLNCLVSKVFDQASYGAGVGSFVEIRRKDENVHAVGFPAAASSLGSAVPHPRKTPASKLEDSSVVSRACC